MYQLPLLPGYGPNVNVRSSALAETHTSHKMIRRMSEAEDIGYQVGSAPTYSLVTRLLKST
jgi:hypothetical protein